VSGPTPRNRMKLSLSSLALAVFALALTAFAAGARGARAQEAAGERPVTQRLVFAHYYYWYQGDPRKPVPFRNVRNTAGLSTLTDHPWESVGPWFSFDRVQWHKNQFQMMAAGGIDVALAVYRGDQANRRAYALKGLDVMTQGLKEFRAEGLLPLSRAREYPQIGLGLDLAGLSEQYGGPVDLKQPEVQRSLYGMVRDFYLHIPEEFRATVQLPTSRLSGGPAVGNASTPQGAAYVVRLLNDASVKDLDNASLAYVDRRFAQEFGARLVWIGGPALRAKAPAIDVVASFPAAQQPAAIQAGGWIRAGSLGPGYDPSAQTPGDKIRPRDNGQQTITDFRRVLDASPDWVFLDSWNGYAQGTDIAPSLEYGLLYRDLTRAAVLQFKQSSEYAATFLKASAPRAIAPGAIYQVEVAVQNTGTADWDPFNSVALSYQWLKDGKPVSDRGASIVGTGQVRGDTKNYLIGVASPIKEGKPLPSGTYELEFNMTRRVSDEEVWFDQQETAPFRIPVAVGSAQPARPYWVNSTMPTLTRRGATYKAQVRLRNDGSDTWKKGSTTLGYRWRKVSTYLKGVADDSDVVVAEGARAPLEVDVAPGRMITVDVPVLTRDAAGKDLATWSTQDDWVYVLEWDLHEGGKYLSTAGGATYREPVEVLDRDPAPYFIGCNLPSDLVAGRTEKITVGLRNRGPETWKKDRDKVIVHWYYLDGTEASWSDDALPLQEDVPPMSETVVQVPEDSGKFLIPGAVTAEPDKKKKKGEKKLRSEVVVRDTVLRDVPVRVPYYFGPMYCVMDFMHDGLHASTSAATKGNDILVIPVNIYSPTFTPLPVSAYFDVDGMSQDVDRGDGDIDGRGNSLPAEILPPYVPRPSVGQGPGQNVPYPCGLWSRPLNDLKGDRVCFSYPSKENDVPNMVSCKGQRITFPPLQRTGLHLLGVCTEEDPVGEFTLYYSDGSSEKRKVTFTHWNDVPKHGEHVAFSTPHRHTPAGDDSATRCYVNHFALPANSLKQLVAVELPKLPAVKVLAITLESATLRSQ